MVKLFMFVAGLAAASVQALPLERRIAQSIPASTQKWEQACRAAGGGERCNPISVTAFSTLLANAGPCEQQDSADAMVNLAKELGSDEMIRLSQIFVQQPRNTPNSIAVPYCQKAPQNQELGGLFQCQFVGANQEKFIGGANLGEPGTIPFGLNAPLNPLGSCPANPDGPIADGTQLVDQVQSPGAPNAPNAPNAPAPAPPAGTKAPEPAETSTAATAAPPAQTNAPAGGGNGGFALANGQAAQRLNAKFATLNANSPCTAGEVACVGAAFAQCVGGQFATVSCAPTTICVALPLVNSPGTSITCANLADAEDRIARTGATGGLAGNGAAGGNDDSTPAPTSTVVAEPEETAAAPAPNAPSGGAGGFKLANGQAAQALNQKFEGLNANSPCQAGENACVNGGFAQCVGGSFAITQCAGGLTCAALPLVNSPGTSITCTTEADALARIQATGATGGITG